MMLHLWKGETANWPSLFVNWAKPKPEPKPAALNADVARQLSPSQLNTWFDCQAKWMYRYLCELPETAGSHLALGRAVHAALAENFRQKIETKIDLPTVGVEAIFKTVFDEELAKATLNPDDNIEDLRDTGRAAVSMYMDDVAGTIEPSAVEMHVQGTISGVPVHGYVDLMDVNGRIIDVKTAKKKPCGIRSDYRLQVATYKRIAKAANGVVKLDTLVKTKTLQVVEQTFKVSPSDEKAIDTLYPLAQEGMRSGLYMPNRNSMLCSRKYCSYWQRCEADFGGCVE
jgi:hypothetical protein